MNKRRPESVLNIKESVLIEEKALLNRRHNFYKIIEENIGEPDLESLMVITLTKIAFCEYLLGMNTTEEGCSVNLQFAINNVNKKYNTNYTASDFFVSI